MKRSSKVTRVCAGVAALCAALAFAGCQGPVPADPETETMVESAITSAGVDVSEVAAVVSGNIVTQQQVDDDIWAERVRYGLEDDDVWADYLGSAGQTEWDVRARAIKGIVDGILLDIEADKLGIDVSAQVEQRVASVESLYPSHAAFVDALAARGYTEESYTGAMHRDLVWSAVCAAVIPEPEPTEEQVRQYAAVVAPTLVGRRSSQILFSSDDYATAVEVLGLIRDGADFAELARTYSIDSTAADGGDMGWDCLNTFTPAYQAALDALEPGEVSGIVRSNFGYHIIMCTDRYDAPTDENGDIDIDAIPDELMDAIVDSMRESLTTQLFDAYIANLEATALIAVFDEDGEQVPLSEVGLAEETVETPDDVDEVLAEVQDAVQDAVDQGAAVIKLSAAELSSQGDADDEVSDAAVEDPTAVLGPAADSAIDPGVASSVDGSGTGGAGDAGDPAASDSGDAGAEG